MDNFYIMLSHITQDERDKIWSTISSISDDHLNDKKLSSIIECVLKEIECFN